MPTRPTVLLLGGTGRTGGRVLSELLRREVRVRAVVRSAQRLPAGAAGHGNLSVVEAELLSIGDEELRRLVTGCDAVISCLGHTISIRGVFGAPRDLVTLATTRVCRAITASRPAMPVKVIVQVSVSVDHPGGTDRRRGLPERVLLWLLRGLVPPTRDNQRAADFLHREVGTTDPFVQWVAIRPDTLLEGEASEFTLHEHPVNSLFRPGSTNMANVARFMGDLVTDAGVWEAWRGKLPVIVNAPAAVM